MIKKVKKAIWDSKNLFLHSVGTLTANSRMKPNFLIIGTQKGGTSSLFYYLKYHSQVKRPLKKEIHYFNIYYSKDLDWYLGYFPAMSDNFITGEASPGYLYHPECPKRIRELVPGVKLIVLLRNPIERAYSAYQMNKRMGLDARSTFRDAIQYELESLKTDKEEYSYDRHNFFYLERGKYAKQLDRWLSYFPKEQIHTINSEDFFNNTEDELLKVYDFLDIEKRLPPTFKPMNVGKYSPISEDQYINLKDYFKNDLLMLKEKWNIEFSLL